MHNKNCRNCRSDRRCKSVSDHFVKGCDGLHYRKKCDKWCRNPRCYKNYNECCLGSSCCDSSYNSCCNVQPQEPEAP